MVENYEMRAKLEKRLIEYDRKIDDGSFSQEDVEDFIEVFCQQTLNTVKDRVKKKLDKIKGIIARHYGVEESQICCGDVRFEDLQDVTTCPFKIILGNV